MARIRPPNADQRNRLSFNKLLIIPFIWSRWPNRPAAGVCRRPVGAAARDRQGADVDYRDASWTKEAIWRAPRPSPQSLFLDIACRTDGLSIRAAFIPEIGGLIANPFSCEVAVSKWPSRLPIVPAVPITRLRRSKLLGTNRLRHKHCDNALCRLFKCAAASH
jgi:hypothetical protein